MFKLQIPRFIVTRIVLALAFTAGAGLCVDAQAQPFPEIRVWAFPGAFQDSSLVRPGRCLGAFQGPLPDRHSAAPTHDHRSVPA